MLEDVTKLALVVVDALEETRGVTFVFFLSGDDTRAAGETTFFGDFGGMVMFCVTIREGVYMV